MVVHDGAFWKWRLLGGFVTLADEVRRVAGAAPFDVVLASSMIHLPAFLGAARPCLDGVPAAIYFHESQFTYPTSPLDRADETYGLVNWTSAAAADLVVFNSDYHRREFFAGARRLLRRFPDHRHTHLVHEVEERAVTLPVGVALSRFDGPRVERSRPTILWNQRWEHDKDPATFASAMERVAAHGVDFDLVLAGERFVTEPPELDRLRSSLGSRIVFDGYADDDEYPDLLARSDVVISTASQEFFGVAVTEAVYAGAFPLLPDRLVYPERIPSRFHTRCLYEGDDDLVDKAVWALTHPDERRAVAAMLAPTMAEFDWTKVASRYDAALEDLVNRSR